MGCGSSSLKGEKQSDINEDKPQPIKKVQTNFSTVDYDAAATGRRDTIVAPHDPVRQKSELPPLQEHNATHVERTSIDPQTTATGSAPTQTQPTPEFENRIPDQPINRADPDAIAPKEPYRDVTRTDTGFSDTPPITNYQQPQSQFQPQTDLPTVDGRLDNPTPQIRS